MKHTYACLFRDSKNVLHVNIWLRDSTQLAAASYKIDNTP